MVQGKHTMKICFRVVGSLLAATFCVNIWAESVDWPAYRGQCYTVAAGAEITVTESEMAAFNQISELKFADKTGKVVFDGCLTAPDVAISGAGTVEKRGDGIWVLSRMLPNYTGSYVVGGGFVSMLTNNVLGALSETGGDIVVSDGATLCVSNRAAYFKSRLVRFAGSGFGNSGAALIVDCEGDASSSMFQAGWSLDGDASVRVESGANPYLKSKFNLNGHTLRKFGTGHVMHNSGKANGGAVIIEPGASASLRTTWTLRESGVVARADPLTPLYLNNFSTLRFWNNDPPQDGPLYASGDVRIQRYNQGSSGYLVETPDYNNWLGPIVMSNAETTLTFTHSGGHKSNGGPYFTNRFHVAGCISGPGSVVATGSGRLYLDCPTNAWTGTTTYTYEDSFSRIILGAPGSVPDYSKFSIDGVGARVNLATYPWTLGEVVRLMNEATFSPATTRGLAFDATCATDRTDFVVSGADVVALTNETQSLEMSEIGKTVTITGGTDVIEMPRMVVGGGTLRLAGPTTKVKLSDKTTVGAMAGDDWATLRIEDGADVVIDSREMPNPLVIGKPDGGTVSDPKGRIVVSNATLRTEHWATAYRKAATNAFLIGSSTKNALFETREGAVVSNKFVMTSSSGVMSAVHQYGGEIAAFGDSAGGLGAGTVIGYYFCHGYWRISGGRMVGIGPICVAQNNATAVFEMLGGRYDQEAWNGKDTFYVCSSADGCVANVRLAGDSVFRGVSLSLATATSVNYPAATLTVADAADVDLVNLYTGGWGEDTEAFVNLNGGVLAVKALWGAKTNSQCEQNGWPKAYVNFNGGTLRCKSSNNVFGIRPSATTGDNNTVIRHVVVYKGGATMDVPTNVETYVQAAFERPSGGGVERIGYTTTEYATAPLAVRIIGDGEGASAICDYDPESGLVTNVTVTSRGTGYTWAKACFVMGSTTKKPYANVTNAVVDCVITSNDAERQGGFTKTGPGVLHLAATNDWAGVTTVAGGILQTDVDWALPSNACVRLSDGGTLHLYGKAAYITNVVYAAGGGWIKKRENATIPDTFTMETTIDDIVAGKAIAFVGKVDVAGIPLTIFGDDFSALDPEKKGGYPVVTAGSELNGEPDIRVAPLPPNWYFRQREKDIRLVYRKGTLLIVK